MGDKSGQPAGQSRIRMSLKCCLVRLTVCALAVSCWNIPFVILFMRGVTKGLTTLSTYWQVTWTITKSVLLSYAIAPHTKIPGVGCPFSPIHLQTCWHWSDWSKQKRDSLLNNTGCHSTIQFSLALHHASLCRVWCVKSKPCVGTCDHIPASSNLFPMVRGDTLPITAARISVVICLFARAIHTIWRSSLGVVRLEGLMPCLLATLFSWVHLFTTLFCRYCTITNSLGHLYDAPISLMPIMRPLWKSDRWRYCAGTLRLGTLYCSLCRKDWSKHCSQTIGKQLALLMTSYTYHTTCINDCIFLKLWLFQWTFNQINYLTDIIILYTQFCTTQSRCSWCNTFHFH